MQGLNLCPFISTRKLLQSKGFINAVRNSTADRRGIMICVDILSALVAFFHIHIWYNFLHIFLCDKFERNFLIFTSFWYIFHNFYNTRMIRKILLKLLDSLRKSFATLIKTLLKMWQASDWSETIYSSSHRLTSFSSSSPFFEKKSLMVGQKSFDIGPKELSQMFHRPENWAQTFR